MANLMFVLTLLGGVALVLVGISTIYPPATFVVGGLALLRVASAIAKEMK